ncbi:patatin-like phospholipase family protein [Arcobacter cloacae]|uniref:Patatin n=1 Tax=Arcobacter cloacae TaxID=1054034 RepID=A0A6M8NR01_9BACT|nr:patatin-like phospholipase family protein [Arcobacter cloacae]QKF91007.1 Patatin-like phospholipase [Arcobacter cloacae]RXI42997.1 patatin [Arcobacter cloacae]
MQLNNIAFALGGGASRGAFHLGVLDFCEQQNIDIKAYSGSSIGAIIAASHASGIRAKEQLKIFSSKDVKQALKFNYFKNGLLKIDTSNKIIKELLPIEKLEDIPKPIWLSAYDIKKKQLHYFNSGDTVTLCMASSALIPLFKPISYEGMYLIDGGLFDNLPIKPLQNKGYDIHTLDLFAKESKIGTKNKNPIKNIKRLLFKQLHQNHKHSIENTNYYLGSPHIKNFSLFTFQELEECFKLGVKEAQNHFLDTL